MSKEIEIKFFITIQALAARLKLKQLKYVRISQSFVPKDNLAKALLLIKEFAKADTILRKLPQEISYARIRKIKESGKRETHYFTIKSPKNESYTRLELEIPIDRKLYRRLRPLATAGTVKKIRYQTSGSTWHSKGNWQRLPSGAEIDFITHVGAGKQFSRIASANVDFALVDVEFSDRGQLRDFLIGRHNLEFLRGGALRIPPNVSPEGRYLSMRYLAKNGIDREVKKVISKLKTHCRKGKEFLNFTS